MPDYIALDELKKLFNFKEVSLNKINCIKMLRSISGEGLKETKDFLEEVILPAIEHQGSSITLRQPVGAHSVGANRSGVSDPPMYLVGHSYKQRNKNTVLILGVSNFNTDGETVYFMDGDGNITHCYNRRDFGRVTGTDHNNPDPRNLEIVQ
jgi:hypothetical protein